MIYFSNKGEFFLFGGYSDRFLADSHFWVSDKNKWSGSVSDHGPFYPNGISGGGISCQSYNAITNGVSCFLFGGNSGLFPFLDNLWNVTITFGSNKIEK